jgi:hypothetical protein
METGERVKIGKGQPWEGEVGTYIREENTLVGIRYRIALDNGFSVLQSYQEIIELKGE